MTSQQPMLRLDDVSVAFGGIVALDRVGLEVNEGDILGLIGPNGSGKTTLLNCVTGIYRPSAGKLFFKDTDLGRMATHRIVKAGIARTFQNFSLFPSMSVLDNVRLARQCRKHVGIAAAGLGLPAAKRTESSLSADAEDIIGLLGLSGVKDARPSDLPTGLVRLADLARALALDPMLLLLDEPAAGMNATEKNHLRDIVIELGKRITIVLVEHDMPFVMGTANRVCVLNFGTKIAEGTPLEVQQDRAVIEAYLGAGR